MYVILDLPFSCWMLVVIVCLYQLMVFLQKGTIETLELAEKLQFL